jgi:hypothetical protein
MIGPGAWNSMRDTKYVSATRQHGGPDIHRPDEQLDIDDTQSRFSVSVAIIL